MPLLVKNGEIVTSDARYVADIWCEGETITRIGKNLEVPPGAEIIDATGRWVFPGFIDPHTHIYLPFMGTFAKDNYETATKAALVGGTTTVFDMCVPGREADIAEGYATWQDQASGRAACDYSFHLGVSRFDDASSRQLREIVADGIRSFKVFLAYKGALGVNDTELYRTLRLAKELDIPVAAHCENETLVAERQAELLAAGRTAPEAHHESRPPIVEAEGVHHLMTFAELTGAAVYIVHLSCEEALAEATAARLRGVTVHVETLIQYLLLDKTFAERANFEGAKFVMSPPLRLRHHQDVLWRALASGLIDTVATDHAPFDFAGQKNLGAHDFTRIPNGIPAIEDRINLLWTYGVQSGRLDMHRFVEVASTRAAKLFGLFPRKGAIQIGADADLVIYDPNYRGSIEAARHVMNVDYNAFEGIGIRGRPEVVTVRGEVAAREGKFVGKLGRGKLLRR
jgi:dihydropyrimidinase